MKISNIGLSLIKKFEGCCLTAYRCPAGVLTIGYGHTKGVTEGMTITKEQAEAYLLADVAWAEKAVNDYMDTYNWNQNQFDALVSFTFNCGAGNLKTLLRDGCRTIAEISEKIPAYNKANGETLPGLERRRAEERKLFDKATTGAVVAPEKPHAPEKTIDELAQEVLEGKHGNDDDRVKSLGDKYDAVQDRVNEILGVATAPKPEKPEKPAEPAKKAEPNKTDYAASFNKEKAGTYRVTASVGLNMRRGASTEKAIIETLSAGALVACYGYYTGEWLYVKAESGAVGFCHGDYLERV